MGYTKNPIIIQFAKLELEGDWQTSFSNPNGAVTFEKGPKNAKLKITFQNGKKEEPKFDPTKKIRVFRDVVHFSKK